MDPSWAVKVESGASVPAASMVRRVPVGPSPHGGGPARHLQALTAWSQAQGLDLPDSSMMPRSVWVVQLCFDAS